MIITATDRLARVLHQEYDWKQVEKGTHTWPTAQIRTLNAWLYNLWDEGMYSRTVQNHVRPLQPAEEQIIWEDILRSNSDHQLLDVSGTAELVGMSWQLLCDWRLPLEGIEWKASQDSRAFQQWAFEFQSRCKKNRWVSGAELLRYVADLIRGGHISLPEEVELGGFLVRTPAQQDFFDALGDAGTRIKERPVPDRVKKVVHFCANDPDHEIRVVAQWARQVLETDPSASERTFQIGVIVPDLGNRRSDIERVFTEVFHPDSWLQPEKDPRRLFNITLGLPVSEYPIIQSALQILSVDPEKIPIEIVTRLLLSPYLPGYQEERTARAILDVSLRERREQYVTLESLVFQAKKEKKLSLQILISLLQTWQEHFNTLKGSKRPSEWAESFSKLLQSGRQSEDEDSLVPKRSLGWPGDWDQRSTEYQTYMVWKELISALVELDGVCGRITRQRAVTILCRMASDKIFQPESDPAPVQILGMIDACGLSFDHQWILGMHDYAWPVACTPVPFLPLSLQRRSHLWRSTPEGVLEYSRILTDTLLKSAPVVMFSHPEREGDAECRVSPLLAGRAKISEEDLQVDQIVSLGERIKSSSILEEINDDYGLPYEDAIQRGGTYLFKLQSACPFRAFAEVRLGATSPALLESGLDARDRGTMMHTILDQIWGQLGDHAALQSMSKEEEKGLVRGIIKNVLERRKSTRKALRTPSFMNVEQARLERIIGQWLDLERERQSFRVLGQEEKRTVTVGGIEISIREDRVDILENGDLVILDYKTGQCNTRFWDGDRPDEPQLPIYATVADSPVAGIFFGSLKVGKVAFEGRATGKGIVPGRKQRDDFGPQTIQQWKQALQALGKNIRDGCAVVDPKDSKKTCDYCTLPTFCRVGSPSQNIQEQDD